MKLTGERPMEGATPDSLLALHDAGLPGGRRAARPRRRGRRRLRHRRRDRAPRRARPARDRRRLQQRDRAARRARPTSEHAGGSLEFVASDGAALGLRDRSVDYVVSSHIIEHFVNPALHVIELARVAARRRHRVRDHAERARPTSRTRSTCTCSSPSTSCRCSRCSSTRCTCSASKATTCCKADFATRRASGERLLRLDVLEAPPDSIPRARVRVGVRAHPAARLPVPRQRRRGIGSGIDESHFFTDRDTCTTDTPVLVRGRAQAPRRCRDEPRRDRADSVWVTVPTLDEVENIDTARAPHPRRGPRRAHPRRRRRQPRRHRRQGRSARRGARRHRSAAPPAQDGPRQRVPRRPRDRHRARLRRHGPDRRRPLARSGRAPRAARRGRRRRRPRDRLALRARRRRCPTGPSAASLLSVWGNRYAGVRARATACTTPPRATARTARRSCRRWTSSRRTPPATRSRSR